MASKTGGAPGGRQAVEKPSGGRHRKNKLSEQISSNSESAIG